MQQITVYPLVLQISQVTLASQFVTVTKNTDAGQSKPIVTAFKNKEIHDICTPCIQITWY